MLKTHTPAHILTARDIKKGYC